MKKSEVTIERINNFCHLVEPDALGIHIFPKPESDCIVARAIIVTPQGLVNELTFFNDDYYLNSILSSNDKSFLKWHPDCY